MEIMLTDRYKLKTFDRMNLQLWEHRSVEKRDGKGGKPTGEVVEQWVPCGNYFPDVPSAVRFVYEKLQRDDPYRGDLGGAIARLEAISANLEEYIEALDGEEGGQHGRRIRTRQAR